MELLLSLGCGAGDYELTVSRTWLLIVLKRKNKKRDNMYLFGYCGASSPEHLSPVAPGTYYSTCCEYRMYVIYAASFCSEASLVHGVLRASGE